MPANRSGMMCEVFVEVQKAARKDMADVYRNVRRESPAMARLLYWRVREAERQMTNVLLYGEANPVRQ